PVELARRVWFRQPLGRLAGLPPAESGRDLSLAVHYRPTPARRSPGPYTGDRSMSDNLLFDINGHIATITLNRPEKLNAFTTEMLYAWADALQECQRNDQVRVVVLTGTGRGFCSGGDVNSMGERKQAETPIERKASLANRVHRIPLLMDELDKPVLVAINGVATGAGLDMALMGDIRIAAASARMAETYVRVGIMAGDGGAWYLPRIVGIPRALELLWSGRFVDAEEAERIGLVNKVVPDEELMP